MENLNLTRMEEATLRALINDLYAEPGFSDVDSEQLSKRTGISMKQIRGVISSLIKKGIIYWHEEFDIIYLETKYYYLHPDEEWIQAGKEWTKEIEEPKP